jgi:O-antigen/teichoic acid export membrane protein
MRFIQEYIQAKHITKKATQAFILYGSMILTMGISFVCSMFTTRYLNPDDYGGMKFIMTLWYFLNISVSFGFFHSAGQALLKENDAHAIRQIVGVELLVALVMGAVISASTYFLAETIQSIFKIQVATELRLAAPLLLFMPIKDALALVFQCTNRISLLVLLNFLPPLFFLGYLVILPSIWTPNIISIIYAQQGTYALTIIALVMVLKPELKGLFENLRKISQHQKEYGTPVFIAVLSSVAMQQINRLSIVYWVDSASIGYYSLANHLAEPVRLIPSTVATTAFKDFSKQKQISNKIFWATIFAGICALAIVLLMLGKPLELFYPLEYVKNIAPLGIAAAFGSAVLGFGELYNRFLGAHGQGKSLRNTAFLVGIFNIIGFLLLTPIFGVWGTLGSSILANLAFLSLMVIYYKKYLGNAAKNIDPENVKIN